jgi:hypothetical protein
MVIDPKIEDATRAMLGQAIRGDPREIDETIETIGEEVYGLSIAYCIFAAAYIAIDVSGRWPTDADVREIARHATSSNPGYELSQQDVYNYISRVALADENINDVFPRQDADIKLPVLITARLLLAFQPPKEIDTWGYLDTIWNAINAAERTDLTVLPALMLRSKWMRTAASKQQTQR